MATCKEPPDSGAHKTSQHDGYKNYFVLMYKALVFWNVLTNHDIFCLGYVRLLFHFVCSIRLHCL